VQFCKPFELNGATDPSLQNQVFAAGSNCAPMITLSPASAKYTATLKALLNDSYCSKLLRRKDDMRGINSVQFHVLKYSMSLPCFATLRNLFGVENRNKEITNVSMNGSVDDVKIIKKHIFCNHLRRVVSEVPDA